MSAFYFDTHMHFDLYKNRQDVLDQIERHASYTIAMTNLPVLYQKYYSLYKDYKYVRLALGFHPELAYQYYQQKNIFSKLLSTTRYIGEVGLDYTSTDDENRRVQRDVFSFVVEQCSVSGDKILSVHSRKAVKDVMETLTAFNGKVILHWYTGTELDLLEAISRGYFFSVNHQMLRSNSGKKVVDLIPLDHMLIESDAPFTQGLKQQYQIDFVDTIYDYLSDVRNIDPKQLSDILKSNFRNLLL